MKKVFLEDLPRYHKGIDWKNCIGFKIRFIYDDIEGELEILNYEIKGSRLDIKYKDNVLNMKSTRLMEANLGKITNKYSTEYRINIGDVIKDENRDLVIIERKKCRMKNNGSKNVRFYKIKCNKCNFNGNMPYYKDGIEIKEHWMAESTLLDTGGCPCCCASPNIVVKNINSIYNCCKDYKKYGIDYEDAIRYSCMSGRTINVTCPDCKRRKDVVISYIFSKKTIACTCGDGFSYPSKFMMSMLSQLNLDYETEYSPKYLILNKSKKKSDFFLDKYSVIIETDGRMGHEGGVVHSKSNKTLEELIAIDKWKDEQHLLHGVKTIRINCFESNMGYIRDNILKSELVNYFDFSKVDWLECERFALSNRVKEVCDYWSKERNDINEISLKFKINVATARMYLKKGNLQGWCDYKVSDGKKKVEILKNGESLGVFDSLADLDKLSKEVFGVKLDYRNISAVCLGKAKHSKGYTFRYVE